MIVKCDQCQTRFKIPDEKVTDKGVKVRCTKCQNTFRVKRGADGNAVLVPPAGAAAAPPPPAAPEDPFAAFGPPQTPHASETTRPGIVPAHIEASRAPVFAQPAPAPAPAAHVFGGGDPDLFDQPTRVGPMPNAVAAFRNELAAEQAAARAAPNRAAAADLDPFADVLGLSPSQPTAPAQPAHDPFADALASPMPPPAKKPAPTGDPFFDSLADDGRTNPGLQTIPREAFAPAPQRPPAADPFALGGPAAPSMESLAQGGLEFDVTGLRNKRPAAAPSAPAPAPASSTPRADLFGEDPPREQFPDLAPPSGGSERQSLFDMPQAAAPSPTLPPPDPEDYADAPLAPPGAALGKLKLEKVPASQVAGAQGAKPTLTGELPAAKPRRRRGVAGNLVAALLMIVVLAGIGSVFLNEGKLDGQVLSLENARALFSPPGDYLAVDVSNGLYDTKAGRPVFFVRGEVQNRGKTAAKVRVRAEILDDATLLRFLEVNAGASPTPEELFSLKGSDEVAALNKRLDEGAKEIGPGQRVPFLMAFDEYPPDLASFRLKVTVTPLPAGQAQR